ncbi:hypothetical protein [Halorubrum vacuolatum]|uniref:Uncharacterized protein n=1 Tax=Halorubrum vacuolatum TaxID=63740 RepID=A0A238VQ80_HALVU|nr:hypothetical protein [Halorubrum vacuolatum]SNR36341.1 hypothetical protein SAMN06264855_103256 [Halorubrum vacuolatum]
MVDGVGVTSLCGKFGVYGRVGTWPVTPAGTAFELDVLVLEEVVDGLVIIREPLSVSIFGEPIANVLC